MSIIVKNVSTLLQSTLIDATYELITFDRDFVTFYENKAIISVYNNIFSFFFYSTIVIV